MNTNTKKIITISREFGSGGRFIGKAIAEKLGYSYYDKELIEKIATESGLSEKFIEKVGEYAPVKSIFAYSFSGRDRSGVSIEDYLYNVQRKIILELADKGNCVIIGRCADYILRDRNDCLNVFITSDEAFKTKRVAELYDVSENEAKKMMKDMDKKRKINYNYYTDRKWGDMRNYSMSLSSSALGIDRCVDLICEAL